MRDDRFTNHQALHLRPTGVGRYFSSAFLLVWLCGWAAGEGFVLYFLLNSAKQLLDGDLPLKGGTVAVGAFLLLWLTFWTFGGLAAMRALLRAFCAKDSLLVEYPGLRVVRRLGPFRTNLELRRGDIRRIHVRPGTTALVAETADGTVELSTLGTPRAREDAARQLTATLGINPHDAADQPATLPERWCEIIDPEGGIALVSDPVQRKKLTVFVSILALLVGLGTAVLIDCVAQDPNLFGPTAMAVVASAGLFSGAVWLARVRAEWRIQTGRLILRRRFGRKVRDLFEGVALELNVSSDSDGDRWYELDVIAAGAPPDPIGKQRDKSRRLVTRRIHNPHVPRQLGLWLAARAEIPLRDRTTPEAREGDYAAIRKQLEKSGRFGKIVAGLLDRVEKRPR